MVQDIAKTVGSLPRDYVRLLQPQEMVIVDAIKAALAAAQKAAAEIGTSSSSSSSSGSSSGINSSNNNATSSSSTSDNANSNNASGASRVPLVAEPLYATLLETLPAKAAPRKAKRIAPPRPPLPAVLPSSVATPAAAVGGGSSGGSASKRDVDQEDTPPMKRLPPELPSRRESRRIRIPNPGKKQANNHDGGEDGDGGETPPPLPARPTRAPSIVNRPAPSSSSTPPGQRSFKFAANSGAAVGAGGVSVGAVSAGAAGTSKSPTPASSKATSSGNGVVRGRLASFMDSLSPKLKPRTRTSSTSVSAGERGWRSTPTPTSEATENRLAARNVSQPSAATEPASGPQQRKGSLNLSKDDNSYESIEEVMGTRTTQDSGLTASPNSSPGAKPAKSPSKSPSIKRRMAPKMARVISDYTPSEDGHLKLVANDMIQVHSPRRRRRKKRKKEKNRKKTKKVNSKHFF